MFRNLRQQHYGFAVALTCLVAVAVILVLAKEQSLVATAQDSTQESQINLAIIEAARKLHKSGTTTAAETIRKQLERARCQLSLLPLGSVKLTEAEAQQRVQKAHLRVGWIYLCTKCDQWHINLAAGYALTKDGAMATCYHVVHPPRDIRTGALIAANHEGKVFPVVEVLAANRYGDACIIQVRGEGFTPVPLNPNISAGDAVYCLSNPQGERDGFNRGVVTGFLQLSERRLENVRGAPLFVPLRIQVTATWGTGDSGSALLDECGNAIGHASTVTLGTGATTNSQGTRPPQSVFHEATSAKDILSLVEAAK